MTESETALKTKERRNEYNNKIIQVFQRENGSNFHYLHCSSTLLKFSKADRCIDSKPASRIISDIVLQFAACVNSELEKCDSGIGLLLSFYYAGEEREGEKITRL